MKARRSVEEIASYGIGGFGSKVVTLEAEGHFMALQFLEDTEIDVIEGNEIEELAELTGRTLIAGITIFGQFTKISIASGLAIAYYA